jgi:MscS family membrane protein
MEFEMGNEVTNTALATDSTAAKTKSVPATSQPSPSYYSYIENAADFVASSLTFQLCTLLLLVFCINWIIKIIKSKLAKMFSATKYLWDEAIVKALYKPLRLLVWLQAVLFVPSILNHHITVKLISDVSIAHFRMIALVGCLFWAIISFVNYIENEIIFGKNKASVGLKANTNISGISKIVRFGLILIFIFTFLQMINFPLTSLLAFGGLGTVAISFAAKDTLANFFGGMMIFMDKPFKIGDWIRSPDREIEGTVEYIGWRLTRLRTFDKRPLFVPNSVFSTIAIENPTRMHNRRIKKIIGLRYEDAPKINSILSDIELMLSNHPEVDANALTMVNLFEFAESSLNILVYTFTKTTDWGSYQAIQQDILLKIIDIITQHGAECAFPSRTMYFAAGGDASNLAKSLGA